MKSQNRFRLIGVVHLLPLPGTPFGDYSFAKVLERAVYDAKILEQGGIDTIIIENFGDAPFTRNQVDPHIVSMITVITQTIIEQTSLQIGINVLRNDALSALAIAAAVGAEFIRVNIHTGAAWTDQGLIQGDAYRTLNYRRQLQSSVAIAADVMVKHATPAGDWSLVDAAKDAFLRGKAQRLIITGAATGASIDWNDLIVLREHLPAAELWIGSGMNPRLLDKALEFANGAIVGTFFHENSDLSKPLSLERVQEMVQHLKSISASSV